MSNLTPLTPVTLEFKIPELLKNKSLFSLKLFPELHLEDVTEHKEYKSKHLEIIEKASHYIDLALYTLMEVAIKKNLAIYSYFPYYRIEENGKLISEFYYYVSSDLTSDIHSDNRPEMKDLEDEGIYLHSMNVTKYFNSIRQ